VAPPAGKSARKTAVKAAAESAVKAAGKTVSKTAGEGADKAAAKTAGKTAAKAPGKAARKVAPVPVPTPVEVASNKGAKKVATKKVAPAAVKAAAKAPAKTVEKTAKKEAAKAAIKTSAKTAAKTAARKLAPPAATLPAVPVETAAVTPVARTAARKQSQAASDPKPAAGPLSKGRSVKPAAAPAPAPAKPVAVEAAPSPTPKAAAAPAAKPRKVAAKPRRPVAEGAPEVAPVTPVAAAPAPAAPAPAKRPRRGATAASRPAPEAAPSGVQVKVQVQVPAAEPPAPEAPAAESLVQKADSRKAAAASTPAEKKPARKAPARTRGTRKANADDAVPSVAAEAVEPHVEAPAPAPAAEAVTESFETPEKADVPVVPTVAEAVEAEPEAADTAAAPSSRSRRRRAGRAAARAAADALAAAAADLSETPAAAAPAASDAEGHAPDEFEAAFDADVDAEIDADADVEAFIAEPPPAPVPDPTPLHSHFALRSEGQARHLAWLPGRRCPAALRQRAEAALDAAGHWPLGDAAGLQALLAAAAEAGHRIDVDAEAWEVLAEVHDAQRRVLVLETALPDGPECAALRQPAPLGLLAQPLNRHQAEAALLAACAGRCALADDAGLGKAAQALGALVLQVRYFGVERVLIAAPADRQRRWQRLLQQLLGLTLDSSGSAVLQLGVGTGGGGSACVAQLRLVALEDLVADPGIAPWQAWAPQLLLVDEGSLDMPPWSGPIASALQALEVPALLVLLRSPLAQHAPESIVQLLEWLDPLRLGPTERLLRQHTRPAAMAADGVEGAADDAGAAALAWQDLEHIGDTLLPLLLRRRPAPGSALPVCAGDDIHGLPMLPVQRQRHEAARARLEALRSRWMRLGDLSSREQAELRDALREMHAACVGESFERGPKFDTLLGLLREVHQHAPDTRLVVCSHGPEVITALTSRLDAEGIPALAFARIIDPEALRLVAARFREHPSCRIALVADPVLPALQLDDTAAGVIHLDRIGPADTLARRLRSVRPAVAAEGATDAAVPVPPFGPVLQLVAEGGIEEAWLDLDGAVSEPAAERCSDGQAARSALSAVLAQAGSGSGPADRLFLDRPTLAAWMHLIGRLLAACG
jgi:hypothetical protein